MSSIVISSITAAAYTTPDGVSPTAGVYYPPPGFGMGAPPWFGDNEYVEAKHVIPTIGIGTTRLGNFGPRTFRADLIFVDTTTQAAMGRYVSALAVFCSKDRYNIVCRGTTLTGCKIIKGSAHFIGQEWRGNKSHVVYGFSFEELG